MSTYEPIRLSALKADERVEGWVLLMKIEERTGKNGKPYCDLTIADGTTTAAAKMWNCTAAELAEQGVSERITVLAALQGKDYNGGISITANRLRVLPDAPAPQMFAEHAPIDPAVMFDEILSILSRHSDSFAPGTLADLARRLYQNNRAELLYWSAARSIHHNMAGGLLYHSLRMVRAAEALLPVYPDLDADLLLSATALHDIGKLIELSTDTLGLAEYTVDGGLLGHALIGIEMVNDIASSDEWDPERLRSLKHCIASHHGEPEFGAITRPAMMEASMLHFLDMIDSRMVQYEKAFETVQPGTMGDRPVFGLDNIRVYRARGNDAGQ